MSYKDPEKDRAWHARYYQEHKRGKLAYLVNYYQQNKGAISAYKKRWFQENKERICLQQKAYREGKEKGGQMDIPETLTPVQAADLLGVERRTIIRWCQQGILKGHTIGKRWYIQKDSVAKALTEKKGGD